MPQAFKPRNLLVRPDEFGRPDTTPVWKPFKRHPSTPKQRRLFGHVAIAYIQHQFVAALRDNLEAGYDDYRKAAIKKSKTGKVREASVYAEMRRQFSKMVGDSEWVVGKVFRGETPMQMHQLISWAVLYDVEYLPDMTHYDRLVPPPTETRDGK